MMFIGQVQAMSPPLPKQLIHGDLHYDNGMYIFIYVWA